MAHNVDTRLNKSNSIFRVFGWREGLLYDFPSSKSDLYKQHLYMYLDVATGYGLIIWSSCTNPFSGGVLTTSHRASIITSFNNIALLFCHLSRHFIISRKVWPKWSTRCACLQWSLIKMYGVDLAFLSPVTILETLGWLVSIYEPILWYRNLWLKFYLCPACGSCFVS